MVYDAELRFLRDTYEKCHLHTVLMNPNLPIGEHEDVKLHPFLDMEKIQHLTIRELILQIQPATIYKATDNLLCCYNFLLLPGREEETMLFIGPYLMSELSHKQVMELAEDFGIPPRNVGTLEQFYAALPILPEDSNLLTMLDVLGERIWGGGDKFTVVNLNQEEWGNMLPLSSKVQDVSPDHTVWNMSVMEERYKRENELMSAVSAGQIHRVERLLSGISARPFEQRMTDPVRNIKNYCIIMNTLSRKAAEQGGVHPVYLDSVSSDFAKRIEQLNATSDLVALMKEMFRAYCRLVRKHSIRQYSPPVQKAITYIDSDLTADLSLSALAAMQNVSAGYLSALFKQETGQTLTEHVNQKRIKHAKQLLKTTNLQIQTIAQYCGIVDVHYFSKLFKKSVGKTPKEYRESL